MGAVPFFVLSALTLLASVVPLVVAGPRAVARARLLQGMALAGLLATLGAFLVAALAAALAVVGVRVRFDSPATEPLGRDAQAARAPQVESDAQDDVASPGRRPAWRWSLAMAALLVAFVALLLRAVLMARWPGAAAGIPAWSTIGLVHAWIVSLALFSIGLFAALTSARLSGVWVGLDMTTKAVALSLAALSVLGDGGPTASWLAMAALAAPTLTAWGLRRATVIDDAAADAAVAARLSETLGASLAVVTLVLLMGAR